MHEFENLEIPMIGKSSGKFKMKKDLKAADRPGLRTQDS